MTKVSRLVLAGTPLSVNAGDFGSKQEAVPSQEKSTPKLGACASAGLAPASATTIQNRFNIAASSRERSPLGCMRDQGCLPMNCDRLAIADRRPRCLISGPKAASSHQRCFDWRQKGP